MPSRGSQRRREEPARSAVSPRQPSKVMSNGARSMSDGSERSSVWRRICDPDNPMGALIATDASGRAVAFLNYTVYDYSYSYSDRPAGSAEDLYERAEVRCMEIGARLVSSLLELARTRNYGCL
jgi:hypothetical protein